MHISVSRCPRSFVIQSPIAITFETKHLHNPIIPLEMHLPSAENSPVDSSSVSTSSSFEKPEDNAITSVQTPTQMDGTTQLSQIKVLTRTNCGQNTLKTLSIDKNTTTTKEFTRQLYECYGITLRCKRRVLDWVLMRETLVACVLVTRVNGHLLMQKSARRKSSKLICQSLVD